MILISVLFFKITCFFRFISVKTFHVTQFIVNPGALSFNFKVPIEIVIGTVPFLDSFTTFQQPVQPSAAPPLGQENDLSQPIGFLPQFMMNQYPNLRKL